MTGIARDEARARRLGVTYGTLKAPLVIVSGYAGPMIGNAAADSEEEPRYCPNCGALVRGRRRTYCDAVCSSQFRSRKHYAEKKLATTGGKEE